ncbi:hypothetical protein TWF225_004289 [Orbilia oligospora]|uniref:Uncharacterized protein n=1 Tax=Orbilia oligospora TaxID=2813651 RepID=A0A7C8NZ98_ORBOL|nr:hypothetical protein TWF751_004112 [Orbilia oligospora]KAF3187129.1 hypothetical protein TWF225_004289 [Orbilia oligospora]KAF3258592.1 hypothetical protein TWF217_005369 [Orbilia oligospora]KAF3267009.1 hypothetical protein TWF128_009972 [Orbilia oligospora]KAF3295459.1 hypothetical protein TWF132_001508 [Orbilia oligospora]
MEITAAAATIAEFVFDQLELIPRGQFQFHEPGPTNLGETCILIIKGRRFTDCRTKKVDLPWAWAMALPQGPALTNPSNITNWMKTNIPGLTGPSIIMSLGNINIIIMIFLCDRRGFPRWVFFSKCFAFPTYYGCIPAIMNCARLSSMRIGSKPKGPMKFPDCAVTPRAVKN